MEPHALPGADGDNKETEDLAGVYELAGGDLRALADVDLQGNVACILGIECKLDCRLYHSA